MSTHNATIAWSLGGAGDADFLAGHYSRAHSISFDGGVTLPGSASPSVVKLPWSVEAAADPEELLVAAVSSCHMLWFLDFAKHAGVVVRTYSDEPVGSMGKMPDGKVGVTRIVLRPLVSFGSAPPGDLIERLHHEAHDACFIANSIKSEVVIEPRPPAHSIPPQAALQA